MPSNRVVLPELGRPGLIEIALEVALVSAVEDRRRELQPQSPAGPSEMGLEDLPDVHPTRHAERIEHDLDRRVPSGR